MPAFLLNKDFWIGLAIVTLLGIVTTISVKIYHAGATHEQAVQARAQIKQDIKTRNADVKIQQSVPSISNDDAVAKFLLSATGDR